MSNEEDQDIILKATEQIRWALRVRYKHPEIRTVSGCFRAGGKRFRLILEEVPEGHFTGERVKVVGSGSNLDGKQGTLMTKVNADTSRWFVSIENEVYRVPVAFIRSLDEEGQ